MGAAWSYEALVPHKTTTRIHNAEELEPSPRWKSETVHVAELH
jgi:hypothetical protein